MVDDTLEALKVEEGREKPEIYATACVEAKQEETLVCARCVGECKIY
jgi:hypothetical protein